MIDASMPLFKRNQIEESLARAHHLQAHLPEELRLGVKGLLDLDRREPVDARSRSAASRHYAFSAGPPPGTGFDVLFSSYDVLAVHVALKLLGAGFRQFKAVLMMRELRPALEREHQRILSRAPSKLIDHTPDPDLETAVAEGTLVKTLDRQVCLVLPTDKYGGLTFRTQADLDANRPANICRGSIELMRQIESELAFQSTPLLIELVNPTHQLTYWLAHTEPARRGRR